MRNASYDIHSLEGALAAAQAGELQEWLKDFLLFGETPNEPLLAGLKKLETRTYHGPVLFPLEKLMRICGPEPDMKYKVEPDVWERKVTILRKAIDEGWKPQPLIAAGTGESAMKLYDGNHRYEALVRSGQTEYWAIFHFENEEEKERFLLKQGKTV